MQRHLALKRLDARTRWCERCLLDARHYGALQLSSQRRDVVATDKRRERCRRLGALLPLLLTRGYA